MAGQTTTATVAIPREFLGAGRWHAVQDDSRLGFTGRKMMGLIPVRGHFAEFTVEAQGPNSESEAVTPPRVTMQAASIDTGIKLRDKHLRSGDFLDVERFPQIEFRAERIEHQGQDEFRISGPLTIHGVTRPVELVAHVHEHGADIRKIHATATLDRYQFGVKAWQPMELNLSRKVKLELELTLARA
jgi:polyisoprenoid-binding protein YceI